MWLPVWALACAWHWVSSKRLLTSKKISPIKYLFTVSKKFFEWNRIWEGSLWFKARFLNRIKYKGAHYDSRRMEELIMIQVGTRWPIRTVKIKIKKVNKNPNLYFNVTWPHIHICVPIKQSTFVSKFKYYHVYDICTLKLNLTGWKILTRNACTFF